MELDDGELLVTEIEIETDCELDETLLFVSDTDWLLELIELVEDLVTEIEIDSELDETELVEDLVTEIETDCELEDGELLVTETD